MANLSLIPFDQLPLSGEKLRKDKHNDQIY